MEATAKMNIRQSSKKVRFVLDEVRNTNINDALAKLSFMNKKSAKFIFKTIFKNTNNSALPFQRVVSMEKKLYRATTDVHIKTRLGNEATR